MSRGVSCMNPCINACTYPSIVCLSMCMYAADGAGTLYKGHAVVRPLLGPDLESPPNEAAPEESVGLDELFMDAVGESDKQRRPLPHKTKRLGFRGFYGVLEECQLGFGVLDLHFCLFSHVGLSISGLRFLYLGLFVAAARDNDLSPTQRVAGEFAEVRLLNQLSITHLGRWLKFHISILEPDRRFTKNVLLQVRPTLTSQQLAATKLASQVP